MITDRRSQILNRLQAILGEVIADIAGTPAPLVFRNRDQIPPDKLPAMLLLDGIEDTVLTKKSPRGGPSSSIMALKPEIFALLKHKPLESESAYAPEMNAYRNAIYVRIMFDAQLLNIMGDNGGIEYRGFQTDMQTGRSMWGELQLFFIFHYPLIPSELQEV